MINRQWKRKEAKDRPLPLICSRKQIRHDHLAYGQLSEWGNSAHTPNKSDWRRSHNHRDGDCKSAPFLAFGLVPSYGTFFLFLKQIALSSAAYTRTLLRGFSRMSRKGNGVRNSRNRLWLLEFCLRISAVRCSTLSEDIAEFRYVPLYIADFTFILQSKFHIWGRF